jgi:hypothetical protein
LFDRENEKEKACQGWDSCSARKDYGFKRGYPEKEGTLARYEPALAKWHKLLKEIIRK